LLLNKKLLPSIIIAVSIISITFLTFNQTSAQDRFVPNWIKFTASSWVNGTSGDSEFLDAIEFLIEEKIILVANAIPGKEGTQIHIGAGEPISVGANVGDLYIDTETGNLFKLESVDQTFPNPPLNLWIPQGNLKGPPGTSGLETTHHYEAYEFIRGISDPQLYVISCPPEYLVSGWWFNGPNKKGADDYLTSMETKYNGQSLYLHLDVFLGGTFLFYWTCLGPIK